MYPPDPACESSNVTVSASGEIVAGGGRSKASLTDSLSLSRTLRVSFMAVSGPKVGSAGSAHSSQPGSSGSSMQVPSQQSPIPSWLSSSWLGLRTRGQLSSQEETAASQGSSPAIEVELPSSVTASPSESEPAPIDNATTWAGAPFTDKVSSAVPVPSSSSSISMPSASVSESGS